jgi:protein-arginine kinase activator protein McsA
MDYNALAHMTVNKLREEAKQFPDIKGVTGMKKDELVAILAEKHGLKPTEKKPKKVHKPKTPLSKGQMKKKITELREQRESARSSNDRKKAAILRKRIHSLKRQMKAVA